MKDLKSLKNQTFGIEIELTGITRKEVAQKIADFFDTDLEYIGGGYRAYEIRDYSGRNWTVERDSSIYPESAHGCAGSDDYKVEIVSPILKYDDINQLQELVRKIRKAGAFANSSCGIHVHVGAERFTPQTLRNIVNIIASKEDILYRALKVDGQRIGYCKKTNEELINAINKKKPKTMSELKEIWYAEDPQNTWQHYNRTRYHGLNLHATFTKKTIEFRLFNSTTHAGEIKAYIQFCMAVTNQALTQKRASCRHAVTNNEKYAFRCWMLRLGLIGDEFKTCRHHFLKYLDGNSAWRQAA